MHDRTISQDNLFKLAWYNAGGIEKNNEIDKEKLDISVRIVKILEHFLRKTNRIIKHGTKSKNFLHQCKNGNE